MKIAIAGFGVEGKASLDYWQQDPANQLTVVNEAEISEVLDDDITVITGNDVFANLNGYDLIIRTPGLAPDRIHSDGKIWSATNEFFARCPAPIVGVTGSKGKGTTASLIASILEAAGKKVWLVGNIGVPALDVLNQIQPTDIVVYELSSFQLWDLEKSPHVAVILHMEPDHLDVHKDMDDYVRAKANIRLHQTLHDLCFYHPTNPYVRQIMAMRPADMSDADMVVRQKTSHPYNQLSDEDHNVDTVAIEADNFVIQRADVRTQIPLSELRIPGRHNQENAVAAINAALVFGVDNAAITEGLNSFEGLDHRLKFVDSIDDVDYYDDSIATTPGSAIAAINAFERPKILILGGSSKGAQFDELATQVAQSNIRAVILVGQEAPRLEQALTQAGYDAIYNLGLTTMSAVVQKAFSLARFDDIVILSPACASFDMFTSYADRGDQFIAAVKQLEDE